MKIVLNVSLAYLENEFNRKIEVDDSIKLTDLCEYIIVSFNGNCKHVYDLEMNNGENYLSYIPYNDDIDGTLMNDLRLCDIGINKDSYFALYYGDENSALWKFDIDVDSISNDKTDIDFKVIDGKGVGIIDDINNSIYFYDLFDENIPDKNKGYIIERIKGYDEWNNSKFTVESNNEKIDEYKRKQIRLCMPKNYILNVTLDGFDSLIKRKISVDGDISLSDLCRGIILSMNGDLSHLYTIKRNKDYLDTGIVMGRNLNFLDFKEKQRFVVVYDYGDNWHFKVTVSKIKDGYGNKKFEVLKAVGRGIEDDCGGTWGLARLIDDSDNDWGYDINDYSLDEINETVEKYL